MADLTLFNHPVVPLPHVEIAREPDWAPHRRTRPPHRRPPEEPGDRVAHADGVAHDAGEARKQAATSREAFGIDPSRLLVLQFQSLDWDLLDVLESVFGASVVDERKSRDGEHEAYTYLVQYESDVEYNMFAGELALYRSGATQRGLLTEKQRMHFFDALQTVRLPSPEDRMGPRLRIEGMPSTGRFYLDVDLWHPGTKRDSQARVMDVRALCQMLMGRVTEDVTTRSMLLLKVEANPDIANALLALDFVATVDIPPRLQSAYSELPSASGSVPSIEPPEENAPVACVIDSGVLSHHPLLRGWVGIEEAFIPLQGEGLADADGHGTSVAGLVVYGDIASCIETGQWSPKVRVHSAKILYHDDNDGPVFPESQRVESATENAIRYFASAHHCRVFNLSVGIEDYVYGGGRQFAWAEKLDELARELDVVVVVSAGNRSQPPVPQAAKTREQFRQAVKAEMLSEAQRVCSPATASIAVVVGALARGDATGSGFGDTGHGLRNAFACSPARGPAPFSRTGQGYQVDDTKAAVKPDFVQMGGNYGVTSFTGASPQWVRNDINLGEPTIRPIEDGRFLTSKAGTSFSAPHVTHAAAVAERELERVLGHPASANLIRAVLGTASSPAGCEGDWLGDEGERLQLVGYGLCDSGRSAHSTESRVTLVSEGQIENDSLHVYAIPLPSEFMVGRGNRGLRVSLAFDPPVRASRKEYMARTMWFEACKELSLDDVGRYRARVASDKQESLPPRHHLDLRPTRSALQWSALQVASKEWTRSPRIAPLPGESLPLLRILVGCQKRFDVEEDATPQRYGISVTLWREGEGIDLYQAVRTRVRVPAIEVRVRIDEGRR